MLKVELFRSRFIIKYLVNTNAKIRIELNCLVYLKKLTKFDFHSYFRIFVNYTNTLILSSLLDFILLLRFHNAARLK